MTAEANPLMAVPSPTSETSANTSVETPAQRRAKKRFLASPQNATVLCSSGWREVVKEEIVEILQSSYLPQNEKSSAKPPALSPSETGPIELPGISYRQLMELALRMTTHRELLWKLDSKRVGSVKEVKQLISRIPWSLILPAQRPVKLRTFLKRSRIKHEGLFEQTLRSALEEVGFVVSSEATNLIDIRVDANQMSISLSFSGPSAYKRRYKDSHLAIASMREDFAISLIRWAAQALGTSNRSGQSKTSPSQIFVPFAGSGTLGFEALMFLQNLGPAILPKELAFEEFCCTPSSTTAFLQRGISKVAAASPALSSLIFVENNPHQLEGLKQNILSFQRMLKEHAITSPEFVSAGDDFFSFEMEQLKSADLFTLLNPPWGERLGDKSASPNLFKRIGERLRHVSKSGSYGAIISPSPQCSKAFLSGSKASFHKSINVSSGGKPVIATAFRL